MSHTRRIRVAAAILTAPTDDAGRHLLTDNWLAEATSYALRTVRLALWELAADGAVTYNTPRRTGRRAVVVHTGHPIWAELATGAAR